MTKCLLLFPLLLFVAYSSSSQDFYPECISFPTHQLHEAKVNSSGEIFLRGSYDSLTNSYSIIMKLDKFGGMIWRKHVAGGGIVSMEFDEAGDIYLLTEVYVLNDDSYYIESTISKYRARNGDLVWTETIDEDVIQFKLDKVGNLYALTKVFAGIDYTGPSPENIYQFQLRKFRAVNGHSAWSSKGFTLLEYSMPSFSVDNDNNIYLVRDTANITTDIADLSVTKYGADETMQWQKIFVGSYGGFITITPGGEPLLSINSQLLKLDGNGDPLWSLPIYMSSLHFDKAYNVYGLGKVDSNTILYKINDQEGTIIDQESLPADIHPNVISFTEDKIYAAGTSSDNTFKTMVFVLTSSLELIGDFTIEEENAFMEIRSMLIDSFGSIYVSGTKQTNISTAFIRKYTDNKHVWQFLYNRSGGDMVYDFAQNLLMPHTECLIKISPCTNDQVLVSNEPSNVETCPGTDASFQISATGIGLAYYWYKGDELLTNSTKFSGANSHNLIVKKANQLDEGIYHCTIKGGCGNNVTSKSVSLKIIGSPQLTKQPTDVTGCIGEDAIFTVTAEGGKNVKYQWKKGNNPLTENPMVIGTNSNQLTLKGILVANAGEYLCEITADCNGTAIISQKARLTVAPPTLISHGPTALSTSCIGHSVTLTVDASGTALQYQWRKNGNDLSESERMVGVTTNTLTLSELEDDDAGEYTCVVSGCGDPVTSTAGVLIVSHDQQITRDPQPSSICSGSNAGFFIATSGNVLSYQWMKKNTLLTNDTKYSGVNTASLTIKNATMNEEGVYICLVTTTCGTQLISKSAPLTIASAVSITAHSPDISVCTGDLAEIFIASSGGNATYRWMKDGIPMSDNESTAGTSSTFLYIDNVTVAAEGNYTCQVTPSCGLPYTSNPIAMEVKESLIISEEPISQTLCEGEKLVLSISEQGDVISYQWKFNGNPMPEGNDSGTKTKTLTIQQVNRLDEGNYTCEITGCAGVIASKSAFVQVNQKPKLALQPNLDCNTSFLQWSDLVRDDNNTYGEFLIFQSGSSNPLGLEDIRQTGVYMIVKQTATCSDAIEWNNTCIITGAEENVRSGFEIFPNPTERWTQFRYDAIQFQDFELFDSKGMSVGGGTLSSTGETIFDGVLLGGGIYIVRLRNKTGLSTFERLIVRR